MESMSRPSGKSPPPGQGGALFMCDVGKGLAAELAHVSIGKDSGSYGRGPVHGTGTA
jgi:hypothetical protein